MRITILQTDIIWENTTANLHKLHVALQSLIGLTDLVVLPEMCLTGFSMKPEVLATPTDGPAWTALKQEAKQTGIALAGSLMAREKEKYYNRGFLIVPDGTCSFCDKRHLFSMGGEHDVYTPGKERPIFHFMGWNIRLLICYDLRFPVWSRNHGENCDLLIYVANWPASRRLAWDIMLQARALENQCYVCGVNRIGVDGSNLKYNGGSVIYSPKGVPLISVQDDTEGFATTTLNQEELWTFRKKFPVGRDADNFSVIID